jgi:hypothetical protein
MIKIKRGEKGRKNGTLPVLQLMPDAFISLADCKGLDINWPENLGKWMYTIS